MSALRRFLIASLFITSFTFSQIYPSVTVNSDFDDNIFRSPSPVSDQIYNLNATLEYVPDSNNLAIYYSGSIEFYQTYQDRDATYHDLGMNYYNYWGSEDQNRYYLGGNYLLKRNKEDFNIYDYNQLYLYLNLRFGFDSFILKGGYNFRNRNYSNYTTLNNARHYVFLHGSKTFSTKTTLQLEGNLGLKNYASDEYVIPGSGSGTGTGGVGPGGGGGGMSPLQIKEDPGTSLSHFILVAKIGQAVMEEVGISFTYRQQVSLSPESTFSNPDFLNRDSELFDDPFSYESNEYTGTIKSILPWSINVSLSAGLADKNYLGAYAYVSEEDTVGLGGLRHDNQKYFSFGFEKAFIVDKSLLYSIIFMFDYYFLNNESNSYWYDYKNQYYSFGINVNF